MSEPKLGFQTVSHCRVFSLSSFSLRLFVCILCFIFIFFSSFSFAIRFEASLNAFRVRPSSVQWGSSRATRQTSLPNCFWWLAQRERRTRIQQDKGECSDYIRDNKHELLLLHASFYTHPTFFKTSICNLQEKDCHPSSNL